MCVRLYIFPETVKLLIAYVVETESIDSDGYLIASGPIEGFPLIADFLEQSSLF